MMNQGFPPTVLPQNQMTMSPNIPTYPVTPAMNQIAHLPHPVAPVVGATAPGMPGKDTNYSFQPPLPKARLLSAYSTASLACRLGGALKRCVREHMY